MQTEGFGLNKRERIVGRKIAGLGCFKSGEDVSELLEWLIVHRIKKFLLYRIAKKKRSADYKYVVYPQSIRTILHKQAQFVYQKRPDKK